MVALGRLGGQALEPSKCPPPKTKPAIAEDAVIGLPEHSLKN